MKNALSALVLLLLLGGSANAANATLHGKNLHREGNAIHMNQFDVTLDGRELTAKDAVYHPDSGVVELSGNVKLQFGANARTFPGEVKPDVRAK